MSTRISSRTAARRRSRRSPLRLESLEQKALLAGDVHVALSGGSLVVTGDADDNDITITADADGSGHVTITGNGGTMINGEAELDFTYTNDLKVNLGAGSDTLTIDGNTTGAIRKNLTIDLGSGDNTLNISGNLKVNGNAKATAAAGDDTVAVSDLTANDIYFALGQGTATVSVTDSAALTGSLQVLADAATSGGAHAVTLDGLNVANDLIVKLGTGDATITLDDATVDDDISLTTGVGASTVTVGGTEEIYSDDLVIKTGTGDATVSVTGGGMGALSITTGGGTTATPFTATINVSQVEVDKSLTVNTGAGADTVTVGGDVAHNVSISTGSGDDTVALTGDIEGFVSLSTGTGAATITLGGESELNVAGFLSLLSGSGDLGLTAGNMHVGSFMNIIAGSGHHTINLGGSTDAETATDLHVATDLLFSTTGSAAFNLDNAHIGHNLTVLLGSSGGEEETANTINIGTLAETAVSNFVTLHTGNGGSTTVLGGLRIGGGLIVTTGSGADTVTIGGIEGVEDFFVRGTTLINTGSGGDTINIGVDGAATFSNFLTVLGGSGDDSLTLGENAVGTIFGSGRFNFDLGGGSDAAVVTNGTLFDPLSTFFHSRFHSVEDVTT